jgi:hypothetical protein
MNADLRKLIRLQEVDTAVAGYRARTEAFPERSRALDARLSSAQEGVRKAEEAIRANQTRRKELESRVTDFQAKISKYRDQMMAVKTNEEYRAMVREIEYTQTAITREEDGILALMEEVEQLQKTLEDAKATLREDEQTVARERSELEALNAGDTRTLEAYLAERATLEKDIDEDVLGHYERVRKFRGGIGVAAAREEACVICNVRMRPQIFQNVRRNESIITCDSCSRILYDPENFDHPFETV